MVGASSVAIDLERETLSAGGVLMHKGETVTIDGSTGQVLDGAVPRPPAPLPLPFSPLPSLPAAAPLPGASAVPLPSACAATGACCAWYC